MDMKQMYTKINAETWDDWAKNGSEWSVPLSHEKCEAVRRGDWNVILTASRPVPKEWFLPFPGCRILGLASGGGQQMPVFSLLGAHCTVFDYSDAQLERERMVSQREGYSIDIIKGDMTQPLPFADGSFDLVFHPVSNCYVENVYSIWRECFRVLRKGGVLLAGMDNGINFLFEDDAPLTVVHKLPFNPLKMEEQEVEQMVARGDGIQFSHTLEEQIGGQLLAGFQLTHLYEDRDRPGGAAIGEYAPQYIATRAIKP